MSINWVMLSDTEGFTPLPGEQRLYKSPPRTTLSLKSPDSYPGRESYSLQSSGGTVFLTNRRIVYLPSSPTPELQSFTAPILNLHDSRVEVPWFGANIWQAVLQPVAGGGIPATHAAIELKLTFKDGGAYDFHTHYERIRERLQQAVEQARDNGYINGDGVERSGGRGAGALDGINFDQVHLDQLPAYEEAPRNASIPVPVSPAPLSPVPRDSGIGTSPEGQRRMSSPRTPRSPQDQTFTPPVEPPPGYEEVQRDSVAEALERRLREQ